MLNYRKFQITEDFTCDKTELVVTEYKFEGEKLFQRELNFWIKYNPYGGEHKAVIDSKIIETPSSSIEELVESEWQPTSVSLEVETNLPYDVIDEGSFHPKIDREIEEELRRLEKMFQKKFINKLKSSPVEEGERSVEDYLLEAQKVFEGRFINDLLKYAGVKV